MFGLITQLKLKPIKVLLIELFNDKAPISARKLEEYAKAGFYNDTIFHRSVIYGFMIQGGGMDTQLVENKHVPIRMNPIMV